MPSEIVQSDDGRDPSLRALEGDIDLMTFEQILEMDESEDDREFSKSIVEGFFEQAVETFENMDSALERGDLDQLYHLGHFLKGSSATIGLTKVKDSCEKIQRYGKKEKLDGSPEPDEELCLSLIATVLATVKSEYDTASEKLKVFFHLESRD